MNKLTAALFKHMPQKSTTFEQEQIFDEQIEEVEPFDDEKELFTFHNNFIEFDPEENYETVKFSDERFTGLTDTVVILIARQGELEKRVSQLERLIQDDNVHY